MHFQVILFLQATASHRVLESNYYFFFIYRDVQSIMPLQITPCKPRRKVENTIFKLDGSLETGKQLQVVLGNIGNLINGKLTTSKKSSPDKQDTNLQNESPALAIEDGNCFLEEIPWDNGSSRCVNDSALNLSLDHSHGSFSGLISQDVFVKNKLQTIEAKV